jgi:hypothetical protein
MRWIAMSQRLLDFLHGHILTGFDPRCNSNWNPQRPTFLDGFNLAQKSTVAPSNRVKDLPRNFDLDPPSLAVVVLVLTLTDELSKLDISGVCACGCASSQEHVVGSNDSNKHCIVRLGSRGSRANAVCMFVFWQRRHGSRSNLQRLCGDHHKSTGLLVAGYEVFDATNHWFLPLFRNCAYVIVTVAR